MTSPDCRTVLRRTLFSRGSRAAPGFLGRAGTTARCLLSTAEKIASNAPHTLQLESNSRKKPSPAEDNNIVLAASPKTVKQGCLTGGADSICVPEGSETYRVHTSGSRSVAGASLAAETDARTGGDKPAESRLQPGLAAPQSASESASCATVSGKCERCKHECLRHVCGRPRQLVAMVEAASLKRFSTRWYINSTCPVCCIMAAELNGPHNQQQR